MVINRGEIDKYKWTTYTIFFFGCCFISLLLSGVRPDVFFSGDAGLKYLVLRQITETGIYKTLQLQQPQWVSEIWSQGYYPFKPPFVYATTDGNIISFPPAFQWINAPFYRMFGYKGIFIVPSLSILLLWVWFSNTLIRSGVSRAVAAVALFILVFCSPVTLYAGVYWEHSLATLLLFSGVVFLVRAPTSHLNSVALGLLAGSAIWLRPEAMVFCGLLIAAVLYNHSRRRNHHNLLFLASIICAGVAFFSFNKSVYGHILGAHSYQVLADASAGEPRDVFVIASHINARLLIFFPSAIVFYALAVYLLFKKPAIPAVIYQLTAIVILFSLITPFLLPNAGGKQWGPRYFLLLVPAMLITVGIATRYLSSKFLKYRSLLLVLPVIAIYSCYLNVYIGTKTLMEDYSHRVTPGLQFLRQDPTEVVIVQNQYIAQEFAAIFDTKKIFLAEDQATQDDLQKKLSAAGVSEVIYMASSDENKPQPNRLQNGNHGLRKIGDYYFGKYTIR